MQEFLNPSLKPYNVLTREEKHILLDAALDGNVEFTLTGENSWVEKIGDDFHPTVIYRTKPKEYKKLDIPWHIIDREWKWATFDIQGVWLFGNKPKYNEIWYDTSATGCVFCLSRVFKLDTTGIVAEHSLTSRPEKE